MSEFSTPTLSRPMASTPEAKKPYHTPQFQDYGLVNELTRSGSTNLNPADGVTVYSS